ncbi:CoA transferase [Marivita sp. S6314]|uniref:CaiB/BaiF CoA transferase family protein n=1 Tax=Marivita sp. S6314 TaxID=2926406 RepID=UPI001FF6DFDD|nr:CoA transferase [Marivita sp. S6314]MCK0150863.1 CoA transferase [Marivita sp. S6314]
MSTTEQPLSGLRVFDLSQGVAGPYCTMMLAAQGADVIKVEPPEGDWLRAGRNRFRGHTPASITVNIGKRSLAIDLKHPDGAALARRIAASCDIVIESFRPGVVTKFGLDHATLSADRPDLIYASISGFGSTGPLGKRGVIDQIMQAFSGWMTLNASEDGTPQRTRNVVLADQITGLYAYQAISSAIIGRLRFNRGAHIDISLLGAMAAFLSPRITGHVLSDGQASAAQFAPPTGEYPTDDGLLMLAVFKPGEFERLCKNLKRDDLPQDARFATPAARAEHAEALRAEIARSLKGRTALEWEGVLSDGGTMASAVRDIGAFIDTPQTVALDLVQKVDLPEFGTCPLVRLPGAAPWSDREGALQMPDIGQHSAEILRETGLTTAEIDHLLTDGCIRAAKTP